ncbi:MAG TPA: FkbM family methyltransferase, partial [Pirellulales bacterium]|nr:FkbM family methyltransferase [Pirellulales bacterium]
MSEFENRIDQLSPLQRAVYALKETQARLDALERQLNEPIALCGMACRFPGGANDPDSYWRMLCEGVDALGDIPAGRWDADAYYDPDPRAPGKMNSRRGGFLSDIDLFDNHFFEISDREAQQLDPQQRMLLELTWEALEDAGIPPESLRGSRTGVFVGISVSEYSALITQDIRALGPLFSTGTALSIAANRISFAFDFHGPSVAVDTACSSSFVALHLASQAIRNGECTTAIVGGANVILSPAGTIVLTKSGFSAPDGCVRAFDRAASGYVRSEGAGVLVLKPLSAAEAAGDPVYAVLRGSAVHQTGRANGLSAPVGRVQEEALRSACEQAKISPARISYVEAQGTGTLLGDAIEAKALGAALSDGRPADQKCLLGSVKTNIGHLEAASGIASVMKVALALKHSQVPPSLHFNSPSPMIPFDELPLRVATQVEHLPASDEPRIASINGFGYGGSNAHIILEQAKTQLEPSAAPLSISVDVPRVLAISARTDDALKALAEKYRDFLRSDNGVANRPGFWRDVVATAAHRRDHHDCRLAVSASSVVGAADQLDAFLRNTETDSWSTGRRPSDSKETNAAVGQAKARFETDDDEMQLLSELYVAGADVEFRQRISGEYMPVSLPTYAWQKQSLWVDAPNPWAVCSSAFRRPEASENRLKAELQTEVRPNLNTPYIPPESPLEERLAESWSRVLLVQPIGVDDNFFELGGQSLQAAILMNELQGLLKVQIDLVALFEAQTVRELAEYLEQHHSADVAQALEEIVPAHESNGPSPASPSPARKHVERASRTAPLPLSSGQQRFWFLDQLNPGAPIYNVHIAVPLIGELDANILQNAIRAAIRRHESLRTIFGTDDDQPSQEILESLDFELKTVDLSHLSGEAQEAEVRRHSEQQANTAFHLNEAPLFRMALLRLCKDDHTLVVTMHHIIVDGVSLAILLRDVLELYRAQTESRRPSLPELPMQYADFAAWQREGLQGEAFQEEMEFWRQRLDGITPLCLPTDRPRSASNGPRPGTFSFALPVELHKRLEAMCREHHVTPFMFMLAAFNVLLHRYSGQDDFVVGIPVAGRGRLETQNLIGFFVNTLAQRNDLSGDPTFVECLQRVRQSTVESMTHQDLPFDEIAKQIEPNREPNRHPVFQVLFNYLQEIAQLNEDSATPLRIGDVPLEQPPHAGEFDLVLTLIEARGTLNGIFGYNAELFDESTIERAGKHFVRLVESAVDSVDQQISKLEMMEFAERRRLLVEWNNTAAEYPFDKCLHQLFEEQVEKTPDHDAIVRGDDRLTYRELNDQANQLAATLRAAGIRRDELVGLCVRRSPDAVIGMLGILKAGAAFVPLDPTLPHERIERMVLDTAARVVITQDDLAASLGKLPVQWISLSSRETITSPTSNPVCTMTPWNLAYAIFTSGSTGQPKGVLIEHRSIVNVVYGFIRSYDVRSVDRVLQNTSLSFDVSVNEIFPALCAGATVVISSDEAQLDAAEIHRLLEKEQITVAAATPSVLRHLNRAAQPPSSLRLVLSGGEELSYGDVDRLLETALVTNGYGPTEACICATCYPLNETLGLAGKQGRWASVPVDKSHTRQTTGTEAHRTSSRPSIPIGRPLANYRVYIVDDQRNPVPVGCPGELCIAGAGLARGYLNDEPLTAEKFVACPFEPGERMYRTGDRARWLTDGNIDFLGRVDQQIQLRGLRIEIGEIETALAALDSVEAASVVYHKPSTGEPRLVAYVVPDAEQAGPIRHRLRFEAANQIEGLATHEMPNGLQIVHQNEGETEFLYRESFLHNCHLSHGIELFDGCCVFDVGANIGIFALHVAQKCQSPTIHAFEPIPSIYQKLRLNAELHQLNLKAHPYGIADRSQCAEFVYFPDSGAMSGSFNTADDLHRRVADVAAAVEEHLQRSSATELLETVQAEGVAYETISCNVRTISDVIRDEKIDTIDLLKIDVEHGERAVLAGIADQDWSKIQQLVVEVHDAQKDGAAIATTLTDRGFRVETESVPVFEDSSIVITHVYAKRRGWSAPRAATLPKLTYSSTDRFIQQLSQPLRDRLPKYMVPSSFELLPDMPLTSSGKIDRARLPQPSSDSANRADITPPRTSIERQLADIWTELLSVEQVGIRTSFFELGGHSLLATQLVSRINQACDVELRLRSIFETSTIEGLASLIEQAQQRGDTTTAIPRIKHEDDIPLSSVQT